jgi:asparagine synthase (glutamine-hydrolysing)
MPGIVGIISKMDRGQAELELQWMVEAIRHEPSYETGTWIDESLGVYLGWAARKNSFSDGMPLCNERGNVVLVFSGEEFPDPGDKGRLKERGHTFETRGPSYLVHAYEESPTFPAEVNGRFHGLVVDRTRGTAALFNDRYGMHRIYYEESKEAFYFAAEAKAILKVRPKLRTVDARGLGEFIACGCVLENRTLFEGLHLLPGAARWVFRNGSIERKTTYFEPREWEEQPAQEPESYYRDLRDIFSRNLPRYFNGNERIGISLTGGLDTRAIMAWQETQPDSLLCYTFGSMFRDCRDVTVARQVARVCQQPHQVIPVREEFLVSFPRYAERTVYLTDGCTSVSHSPDLYVNERAAKIAPVRMTGNYGDEVLRRQRVFRPADPPSGLFHPEFLSHIHRARETYAGLVQQHPLSFAVFRQAPWHHHGLLALEETQVSLRTPYLDNEFVRQNFRAPEAVSANNDLRARLIADGKPTLSKLRTDLGFGGRTGTLFGAASRRFHRFTMKAEYAYDYGMPQWMAKIDHLVSLLHFEHLFLGRHKFYHFRVWYRDALSNYVREMLLDPRSLSRPYLEPKELEPMVRAHLKGDRNNTTQIHQLLSLELLHRLFVDSN